MLHEFSIYFLANWMSILTMILTIIWLYLEYKASMWLWPIGIILPIFWIIVSLQGKVYGNIIINAYYFVTSIIGWIMWIRNSKGDNEEAPITNISVKPLIISIVITIPLLFLGYYLLRYFTDNQTPMLDSIGTIVSFVGMIWLSKKWRQHWYCWIIANMAYSIEFAFAAKPDYIAMVTMAISLVVAILGVFKWKKMMNEQKTNKITTMIYHDFPSLHNLPKTIILVNGDFPKDTFALSIIDSWIKSNNWTLICCDGAVNKLQKYTKKLPDIVVGDLDSVSMELRQQLGDRVIHIASQDTNDLTKAITIATQQLNQKKILLLGISGGREDHFLANIALLPSYHTKVEELIAITDTGYIRLLTQPTAINTYDKQQISIFNFEHTAVTADNLKWPLDNLILKELWCGSLNESLGGYVTFTCNNPILVYIKNPDPTDLKPAFFSN